MHERDWTRDGVGGTPTSSSLSEDESEDGECDKPDDTSDDTCHEPIKC
jgi:hypothetical protein